jgi:uncharacterized membrane protein (UPF0127 family)
MKKICIPVNKVAPDMQMLEISVADTFASRLRGLLGTKSLPAYKGLLLRGCNSIHMLGMLYALDIVYLDKQGFIVKIIENLKPWQMSFCRAAQDTLEVKNGTVSRLGWKVGIQLTFEDNK